MGRKILIADDANFSRRWLRHLLDKWDYTVTEVEDGVTALKKLQAADAPKLAILDWMMPGLDGTEVVQWLRRAKRNSYTYVLLLTAKTQKSDVLVALESGADDCLTKPFDVQELQVRLRVGERIVDLHDRLSDALSASEFRATHDAMTGLYNRQTILNALQREMARSAREGTSVGSILADVDHFKAINDTYGHSAGDEVLLEVAGRMKSALRPYDSLGRYGGEEFLIVTPNCGPGETQEIAERLRQAVAENPVRLGDAGLQVTISLGATVAGPDEGSQALLKRADSALYDAKNRGRNRVRFSPAPQDESVLTEGQTVSPFPDGPEKWKMSPLAAGLDKWQ